MRAHLGDPVVLLDRIAQQVPIVDVGGQRLLDVNILARGEGVEPDDGVPVIGHGNDDAVDVFIVEHRAIVLGGRDRFPLELGKFRSALIEHGLINIAERLDLRPARDGMRAIQTPLIVSANQTQYDLVIGAHGARIQIQKSPHGQSRCRARLLYKRPSRFIRHKMAPCRC